MNDIKINGGISIPWKVVIWVVVNIFALGAIFTQVKYNSDMLKEVRDDTKWLMQREMAAGPPSPTVEP